MNIRALTTILDLAGALALVAGLALAVAAWSVPAALGAAGLGLLGVSWIITRAAGGQR